MEACISRAADFPKPLTNSENSPETQRKLLNNVVEPPSALGNRRVQAERREIQRRKFRATLGLLKGNARQPQGSVLGFSAEEWLPMRYTNEILEIQRPRDGGKALYRQ